MNRQLRRRHLWVTGLLAMVAALLLAMSQSARRRVPSSDIPAVLRGEAR